MSFNKSKKNNANFSVNFSQRDGTRSFKGEHDDRFYSAPNTHRGRGYRGGGDGGRGRGRSRSRGFKNFNAYSSRYRNSRYGGDEDGDDNMGDDNRRHRGSSRGRLSRGSTRGTRGGRHNDQQGGRFDPEKQWYKVTVPFGARLSQTELFKLIQENTDVQVPFQNYHTIDQRAFFFVQGSSISEALRFLSRRISRPDGQKLTLIVNESGPPKVTKITDEQKKKLMVVMSDRYEASTQVLNLSYFEHDESFKSEKMFLPINKFQVMEAVVKIVAEHIPEMVGVDLSKNHIGSLSAASGLVKAAAGVTSLNLGKNSIRSLEELEKLKGWSSVLELTLDGNDVCSSYTNEAEYISAVRKIFPKVIKLDGKELPPPISFDIEAMPMPVSKGSYFFTDDVMNLLVNFVKEYYTIFDSDNRWGLRAAYNENAQFSYHAVRNATIDKQGDFQHYFNNSRNLKKMGSLDAEKKAKKVKVGLQPVITALEEFPKTTHDLNSFKVDVMMATPQMLSFVLHGVFKETASRADKPIIRTFSRTFITTPAGEGVSIVNDMLTVSNAGFEQASNAFKEGAPTPSSSPASSSQTASSSTQPPLAADHKQMVESFASQSGMSADFSLKCLQENSWDYQRAATNFQELNSQGKIPPEAFIK